MNAFLRHIADPTAPKLREFAAEPKTPNFEQNETRHNLNRILLENEEEKPGTLQFDQAKLLPI